LFSEDQHSLSSPVENPEGWQTVDRAFRSVAKP
jgi:hypothetical protein